MVRRRWGYRRRDRYETTILLTRVAVVIVMTLVLFACRSDECYPPLCRDRPGPRRPFRLPNPRPSSGEPGERYPSAVSNDDTAESLVSMMTRSDWCCWVQGGLGAGAGGRTGSGAGGGGPGGRLEAAQGALHPVGRCLKVYERPDQIGETTSQILVIMSQACMYCDAYSYDGTQAE